MSRINNWLAPLLALLAVFLVGLTNDASAVRAARNDITVSTVPENRAIRASSSYRGDVYLLRGVADLFSGGLDELGAKLNRLGVAAKVISHGSWRSAAKAIVANQKKYGQGPVVLIGHSLGANDVIRMAKQLKKEGVVVDYMVTFAATNPSPVPANVRNVTNYYFETRGWGEKLVKDNDFQGDLNNVDYSGALGIGHFNIEEQNAIHIDIIRNTLRHVRR